MSTLQTPAAGPHDDHTGHGHEPAPHTVTVTVNNRPVIVPAPKATGREIKQAAITSGLPIQLDFVLSQERPNGDTDIIGDLDSVTVNPQSRFLAIAPDDNS